eukprot:snap_masked-scaffold_6-processed-gene-0.16-mRNA-1 protein AED:0.04 eAED:0.07 QI:0/-1/0/1/-1/1/1/0/1437
MEIARTTGCTNIAHVSLHSKPSIRKQAITGFFILLYALTLPYAYSTAGNPYQRALDQYKQKFDELNSFDEADELEISFDEPSFSEEDPVEDSVEQNSNSTKGEEREVSLPNPFLPDALPLFLLLLAAGVHGLFHLLCHWLVWFNLKAYYVKDTKIEKGKYVFVNPFPHRGSPKIVKIESNEEGLYFAFQRQSFQIKSDMKGLKIENFQVAGNVDPLSLDQEEILKQKAKTFELGKKNGFIQPLTPEINHPASYYFEYLKKYSKDENHNLHKRRDNEEAPNSLKLEEKSLQTLIQLQLLTPLAIFQMFSSSLWLLDEYWSQAVFSIVMVFVMESTTAFQQHRMRKTLRNLAPKPFTVLKQIPGTSKFTPVQTDKLSPGDIIELSSQRINQVIKKGRKSGVVPCDCLILSGSAVVNESSLTGESVPQMKDALADSSNGNLEIDSTHRINTLFSGTTLITASESCLCVVLRVGFSSSQGQLLQLIEFSQSGSSNTFSTQEGRETGLALVILSVFALVASSYVFYKNSTDPKSRLTTHELLLKCVIIITSVVPQTLPVQMTAAINYALLSLQKSGIFCTEPFRLPTSGKISHCLFDKTGTLTSDDMVPVGVVMKLDSKELHLEQVKDADSNCKIVIASCHSLIEVDNKVIGDSMELAALKGIQWQYNSRSQIGTPVEVDKVKQIKILHRNHFSSKLQRMSVICRVKRKSGEDEISVVVKGSPEAVQNLLRFVPENYQSTYKRLAKRGMRILALAMRNGSQSDLQKPRVEVESGLDFCGFIAFKCPTRADTAMVINSLTNSGHQVAMITGDAPLTALHVARECLIIQPKSPALMLESDDKDLFWALVTETDVDERKFDFNSDVEGCGLGDLVSKGFNLVLTEKLLLKAEEISKGKVWSGVEFVRVFSRMSPEGKAKVIRNIQSVTDEYNIFMCGDGGNDVGALKQADVGLALLGGYGQANTNVDGETTTENLTETELNERERIEKIKQRKYTREKKAEFAKERKKLTSQQQTRIQEKLQLIQATKGTLTMSDQFSAAKAVTMEMKNELVQIQKKLDGKYNVYLKGEKKDDPLEASMPEEVAMVRPGDASIAAPFTSRIPSIRSVIHMIRQGRCTLLSSLQQQQTMMLECIISAYTLAALSLQGSRQSERQMIASSWFILGAVGSFSYATPLEKMSDIKPLKSLFHPAIFLSIIAQAVIHLLCISLAVSMSKEKMGEDLLQEVIDFNNKAQVELDRELEAMDEESYDPVGQFMAMWQRPFKANLLNTVCFLVQTAQTMSVYFTNYKGQPWMKGLLENHGLFLSIFVSVGAVAICAWEMFPMLNSILQLEPFPDDEFRWTVVGLVCASILGTFVVDRIILAIFAPEIFHAMLKSARETTFKDVKPIFVFLGKAVLFLGLFATGNPIFWIGGYYLYKKRQQMVEKAEEDAVFYLEEQRLEDKKKK